MYLPVTNLSAAHSLLEQEHLSIKKKKNHVCSAHSQQYKYTEYKFVLVRSTPIYHLKPHFHTTPALLKKVLPAIYKQLTTTFSHGLYSSLSQKQLTETLHKQIQMNQKLLC